MKKERKVWIVENSKGKMLHLLFHKVDAEKWREHFDQAHLDYPNCPHKVIKCRLVPLPPAKRTKK